jgi:hypothetical protein
MNLQENYKRLFKGRIRSNDSKLLSEAQGFADIVDVQEFIKVNDLNNRDEMQMFDNEEELIIPLKKGMELNGKNEFIADVDVFDGGTSFLLPNDLVDALEELGIDEDDFKEEMEEDYIF